MYIQFMCDGQDIYLHGYMYIKYDLQFFPLLEFQILFLCTCKLYVKCKVSNIISLFYAEA